MAATILCTDADLYARYGQKNVDLYADLDADANAAKMTARKLAARTWVSETIASLARAKQTSIPSATSVILTDVATGLAMWWLSRCRGKVAAYEADRDTAYETLDSIIAGTLPLEESIS